MEKLTQEQIKDIPLQTDPHYSDPRFDEPQTIFGQEESGLHYDYSDRLWQWDYDKAQKATEIANEVVKTRRTCEWYEAYLSA